MCSRNDDPTTYDSDVIVADPVDHFERVSELHFALLEEMYYSFNLKCVLLSLPEEDLKVLENFVSKVNSERVKVDDNG